MLYIEKTDPPRTYVVKVAEIKSAPSWQKIQDGNTTAIRNQFDRLPKPDLRRTLLADQHYLCAYCMKRIRSGGRSGMVHMNIEHWFPLSGDKERALDYKNLLGVCKGGADVDGQRDRILCCDASKGDEESLTVNPLDRGMMQYIAYKKDGTIYCLPTAGQEADGINRDLNLVLRLNGKAGRDTATGLIKGRRDAYKKAQSMYKELSDRRQLTSAQLAKMIQRIERLEEYPEFAGTILFVLERKRKQLASQGK